MAPFFVLVSVPTLARSLLFRPARHSSVRQRPAGLAVLNGVLVMAMVGFVGLHLRQIIQGQPQAEASHYPTGAVAYLSAHPPAGPIFNHYDWGGYLIFKLYPGVRVYIDGRADLYGDQLMQQRADTYYLMNDWRRSLWQWKIRTVIVPPDSPLAIGLGSAPGWVRSYEDSKSVIFSR
jgi:hypothetical protein